MSLRCSALLIHSELEVIVYSANRGSAILEVVVAGVLGAIVASGVGKMLTGLAATEQSLRASIASDGASASVTGLLTDPKACEAYFGGMRFDLKNTGRLLASDSDTDAKIRIFMPGNPKDVLVEEGLALTGGTLYSKVLLISLFPLSNDKYSGKLHLEFASTSRGLASNKPKEFPLILTAKSLIPSSPDMKTITGCRGTNGASELPTPSLAPYEVISRHSFTSLPPECPVGWELMWEGYSFAGASAETREFTFDLASSGSCLEEFKPIPFTDCGGGAGPEGCDYFNADDHAMWLTTLSPKESNRTLYKTRDILPAVSRCSVCGKSTPKLLVRHSQSNRVPACPRGWSSLWSGYSYVGGTGYQTPTHIDLGEVGSCLEKFQPVNFIECATPVGDPEYCSYMADNNSTDLTLWLTTSGPGDEAPETGMVSISSKIGRCSVCEKN